MYEVIHNLIYEQNLNDPADSAAPTNDSSSSSSSSEETSWILFSQMIDEVKI